MSKNILLSGATLISILLISLASGCLASNSTTGNCDGVGTCFCKMADGKKIDLTDLGEYISGHADRGRLTASGMNYEAY